MAEVKIYTRRFCGYCTAAISFLNSESVAYEEIDCTGDRATRQWLVEASGQTTVPQIFIDGHPIGGYTDMMALVPGGKLAKMLSS